MTTELHRLSLEEQSALIAKRAVSSAELVDHHLARCERLNPTLKAFITIDPEGARAAARDEGAAILARLDGKCGAHSSGDQSLLVAAVACCTREHEPASQSQHKLRGLNVIRIQRP